MFSTKNLYWAYLILLIFEGALRKWILPQFSDVFLVIRDPVVLLIYLQAFAKNKFPMNSVVTGMLFLCIITAGVSMSLGHGNAIVTAFGIRANFLHIPLIYLAPKFLDRNDVIRMAKFTLLIAIAMTPLIALQFLSPQSAFVNRSVGGLEGAGFDGAEGRYRPPGTFSFITGLSMFYTFAAAMLMALITEKKAANTLIMVAAACCIVLAIPLSISRYLALSVAVVIAVSTFFLALGGFRIDKILRVVVVLGIAAGGAQFIPVFSEATKAFSSRWSASTTQKGGFEEAILDRVMESVTQPFVDALSRDPFGIGIGAGTNVGAKFLVGKRAFLAGEGELHRVMNEFGIFFGLIFLGLRWSIIITMLERSLDQARRKNFFPGCIFSAAGIWMFYEQWGPPSQHGFSMMAAILCMAACNVPEDDDEEDAEADEDDDSDEPDDDSETDEDENDDDEDDRFDTEELETQEDDDRV